MAAVATVTLATGAAVPREENSRLPSGSSNSFGVSGSSSISVVGSQLSKAPSRTADLQLMLTATASRAVAGPGARPLGT